MRPGYYVASRSSNDPNITIESVCFATERDAENWLAFELLESRDGFCSIGPDDDAFIIHLQ
jgi:hypothetical protein